jgi:hypothetical protein
LAPAGHKGDEPSDGLANTLKAARRLPEANADLPKRSERETVVTLRLPRDLHDRLKSEGGDRGFAAEIRRRLQTSFAENPTASKDPWFGDLLTAINQAAAGAVKLKQHPPLPAGVMERDGKRENYDVARLGPDTTAYETFGEAVRTLMIALAPEGILAVSSETGMRLADQLVALALGALGERGIAAFANLSDLDQASMRLSGGAARALAVEAEQHSNEEQTP